MRDGPLHVLHLTASLWIGGAERLILDLVRHGDGPGVKMHVCAIGTFSANSFLNEFQQLSQPFYLIPANHFYDPRVVRSVVDYARRQEIDVIHTHLIDADIQGRLCGALLGIPVISTLHNVPDSYRDKRLDRRYLVRATLRYKSAHLVAVSEHIRRLFMVAWGLPETAITTIYNAVDLDRFASIAPGTPEGSPITITNIASLYPQKGQRYLLDAARIVLNQQPQTRFLLVGSGDEAAALASQARALDISDQVIFAGVSRDIPAVLADSDVFVLSSLWEGLPVAAIEAMAAARPLVLTDVGGNRELIESGQQGLLVPPGDAQSLAEALLELVADRSRRESMGRAARTRAAQLFDISAMTRQYVALYERVVQRGCSER